MPDELGSKAVLGAPHTPCERCSARSLSFCSALVGQEHQQLAALVVSRSFAPRQTIVQEGDRADFLLNMTEGTAKLYRALPDGRTQIIGFLRAGDFLGMPPGNAYAISAESITAVKVCCFPRNGFERLLKEFPTLERRLFDMASNEIAAAHNHVLLLGRKTARERVATFLLEAARRSSQADSEDPVVELPMTRAEIADYLGLTMETVSRALSTFREQGLIDGRHSPNRVRLCRINDLHRIAGGEGSS